MERMINRSVEDCGCLPWNFPKLPGNKGHFYHWLMLHQQQETAIFSVFKIVCFKKIVFKAFPYILSKYF